MLPLIGYMLLFFRYSSWFGMTNNQKNLTHSVHQARSFPRCILHIVSAIVHHAYFIPRFAHFIFKIDLP